MLISFSVENWMSFRDKATFSMVATKERQHSERLPKISKFSVGILPIAVIYGGNASGKTNFFKAINFVKNFIIKGTQPDNFINISPFSLDDNYLNKPSFFSFEILVDELIYDLSFSVNNEKVIEEKLIKINSNKEIILYHRKKNKIEFDKSLNKDDFLKFSWLGTRENQLFLTNSVSQKIDNFKPVYDWFKNSLNLVAPDTKFSPFAQYTDENHPLFASLSRILPQLDTGISSIRGEKISIDNLDIPDIIKNKLYEELKEGMVAALTIGSSPNNRYFITRENAVLTSKKLVTIHQKRDGNSAIFEIHQESDGSQRVIDLLPALLELTTPQANKVYLIDELDRSLHPLLTQQLIESYLEICGEKTRTQLLFTTHNGLLLDQKIFRRDEMWVTERNNFGESKIYSFSDYKDVRADKDIRKSYFLGRLGGIPKLQMPHFFSPNDAKVDVKKEFHNENT